MILRTVTLLVSPRAQLYFVLMVSSLTLDIISEGTYISLFSGIFDREYFAMAILFLRLSPPLLLWAFQQLVGCAVLILYRVRNSRFNVLLQYNYIGSTYQIKCFPRSSILLGISTITALVLWLECLLFCSLKVLM
jgi:hypothetical protein